MCTAHLWIGERGRIVGYNTLCKWQLHLQMAWASTSWQLVSGTARNCYKYFPIYGGAHYILVLNLFCEKLRGSLEMKLSVMKFRELWTLWWLQIGSELSNTFQIISWEFLIRPNFFNVLLIRCVDSLQRFWTPSFPSWSKFERILRSPSHYP